MQGGFGFVAGLNEFERFFVIFGVQLGIFHHGLDFVFAQARVGLDGDLVFFAGGLVFGADVQDAVGVDVERHFNLWRAACGGWNTFEVEFAQAFVGRSHFALALVDLDGHGGLVVISGREGLRELRGDRGVLLDHLGHHAA